MGLKGFKERMDLRSEGEECFQGFCKPVCFLSYIEAVVGTECSLHSQETSAFVKLSTSMYFLFIK